MKYKLLCVFFLLSQSVIGCYETPYPVKSESQAIINDTLLGSWVSQKNSALSRGVALTVTREADSPWYHLDYKDQTTGETRKLKALIHKVGDHHIFSFQDDRDDDYAIFRIEELDADIPTFHALTLDENAPKFDSNGDFLKFLASQTSNNWFRHAFTFEKVG